MRGGEGLGRLAHVGDGDVAALRAEDGYFDAFSLAERDGGGGFGGDDAQDGVAVLRVDQVSAVAGGDGAAGDQDVAEQLVGRMVDDGAQVRTDGASEALQ